MTSPAKLRLAIEILAVYVRVRLAMRRQDLPELVGRLRGADQVPGAAAATPRQLAGAVMGLLARLPTDSRCLVRSLVYLALLRRRGMDGEVVIGVRAEPDFAAHAWVEVGGEALLPSGDGEFARLKVL